MFAIVAVFAVLACTWWFYSPTLRFLSGFAAILEDSQVDRSPLRFVSRRSFARGRFGGRAVQLEITQPNKHSPGKIVASMETTRPRESRGRIRFRRSAIQTSAARHSISRGSLN